LRLKEIKPIITRRIFAAFRTGERRNPAIAEFVSELRTVANSMTAQQ
jgi:hypothetical protein